MPPLQHSEAKSIVRTEYSHFALATNYNMLEVVGMVKMFEINNKMLKLRCPT